MRRHIVSVVMVLLILGVAGAGLGFGILNWSPAPITQPIAFNHKIHIETGLECGDCHLYFETQIFSGLPTIGICMDCHDEAISASPEEEKIRTIAAAGGELAWNQIYEMPSHVYYSHRRHVVAGELDCATCHGPIAETTAPPPQPLRTISMDFCLDCHRQNNVSEDCIACHK